MQKTFFCTALVLGGVFFLFSPVEAATVVNSNIEGDVTWTAGGSPYVLTQRVIIPSTASLTVEPGVVVKVASDIVVAGTLRAEGMEESPVIFTSLDDDVAGDTNNNGSVTVPMPGQWLAISNGLAGKIDLKHTELRYGGGYSLNARGTLTSVGGPMILDHAYLHHSESVLMRVLGSDAIIEVNNSRFEDTEDDGIFTSGGAMMTLRNNTFKNIAGFSVYNSYDSPLLRQVDAAYNYWGSELGPERLTRTRPDSALVSNHVITDPFLTSSPFCEVDCFSNVLFLPGIKASRLYRQGITENQLWEPTFFDDDLDYLKMDDNGQSINSDIYTRDVIEEQVHIGTDIYKSFIAQLTQLKTSGTINNYELFAYDWRYDVRDIVENGTSYQTGNKNLVAEVNNLANSSKSKKVTIVAHSNGGLLAKALIQKLEATGQSSKVDKLILIGSPQMGTPAATLSFLYGYDEDMGPLGSLVSRKDARTFVENVPGAYSLLPSQEYFNRTQENIVQFEETSTRYAEYREEYGSGITSWQEFSEFLTGKEGREKPNSNAIELENILNTTLLNKAKATHDALDAWTPPAGLEVIQIAGTGLDTISGVKYTEREKASCNQIGHLKYCQPSGEFEPVYEPIFSKDGDTVVTAPSALMLPEGGNIKNYFINIPQANEEDINRKHKNITEIGSVQNLFDKLLKNDVSVLPPFISTTHPDADSRIRMRLYSPLDVHLYDQSGNHTGPREVTINGITKTIIEENIPNSYYYQLGERKYIGFPTGIEIDIKLEGYAEGSYTLEVDEITKTAEEEEVQNITFRDLPTTPQTTVEMTIPEEGIEELPVLTADTNGDGTNDYELVPVLGEEVTLEEEEVDVTAPEAIFGFDVDTEKLKITSDESDVVTTVNGETYTLMDKAGNTTVLTFEKQKNKKYKHEYILKSIRYNQDDAIKLKNVRLFYRYKDDKRRDQAKAFSSHLSVGKDKLTAHYLKKKNKTYIMDKSEEDNSDPETCEQRKVKKILPGLIIPYMKTNKGEISIKY